MPILTQAAFTTLQTKFAATPLRRRTTYPFCGRLIAVPTANVADPSSFDVAAGTSIDFPAMPDTIDLMRSADYDMKPNVMLPDGIHLYRGTKPLEIPFQFSLHILDEDFCVEGALSLLKLAARLHAFILPIADDSVTVQVDVSSRATTDMGLQSIADGATNKVNIGTRNASSLANPVTCRLELMFIDTDGPGISCYGYVREVGVKLKGPWLRGPGMSYNLPSSGDFSFTFVHHPSHGNARNVDYVSSHVQVHRQAYAKKVSKSLYNTRDLADSADFKSFD